MVLVTISRMPFDPIPEIINDLRAGRVIVLVDDENSAQLRRLDGSLVRTGALLSVSRPVVVGRFLVQDGRRIHVDAL